MASIQINVAPVSQNRKNMALSAIIPGMLLEKKWDVSYTDGCVAPHSGQDQIALKYFAVESSWGEVDIGYTSGQEVTYRIGHGGDIFNALLAPSQVCDIGTPLSSNGDGRLKVAAADPSDRVIVAVSTKKVTSGGTAIRLNVEIVG